MINLSENRNSIHELFWQKKNSRPLYGFTIGSYFPLQRYPTAKRLASGERILPEIVEPVKMIVDYEQLFLLSKEVKQDLVWTSDPLAAIPWIEAMLGCNIYGGDSSIWADSPAMEWEDILTLKIDRDNAWYRKFIDFVETLSEAGRGRWSAGQPILRGPCDLLSVLRGANQFPLDFYDAPEMVNLALLKLSTLFKQVIEAFWTAAGQESQPIIGFYDLLSPGKCLWFQEDATALLSPSLYRQCAKEADRILASAYPYWLVHLHPASLYLLNDFIELPNTGVIEINKDVGGPSIGEMLEHFKRVLNSDKRLMIWGDFTLDELECMITSLPPQGLCIHSVVENVSEARVLSDFLLKDSV